MGDVTWADFLLLVAGIATFLNLLLEGAAQARKDANERDKR